MKTARAGRRRSRRGWILLPAAIIFLAAIGLVISSFQKEVGLMSPGNGGRAAVAAAAGVEQVLASGESYPVFSSALLVAVAAYRNMAPSNPADTRLSHLVTGILDAYAALREAWQMQNDGTWDPHVQGDPRFWVALHPFLTFTGKDTLGPQEVISGCREQASDLLTQAINLAD